MASFDIAEDPALVSSLQYYYEMIDHTTTASTVMLPWLPSPKWCKKLYATLRICSILSRAFNDRLKSGVAKDDTLQMFIDTGDNQTQSIGVNGSFNNLNHNTKLTALVVHFRYDASRSTNNRIDRCVFLSCDAMVIGDLTMSISLLGTDIPREQPDLAG